MSEEQGVAAPGEATAQASAPILPLSQGNTPSIPGGQDAAAVSPSIQPKSTWQDALPENIRDKPELASFDDVGSLAHGFLALVGNEEKGVTAPKGKDGENRDQIWKDLGRPETPDEYQLTIPESLSSLIPDETLSSFRKTAHEAGLSQDQTASVIKFYSSDLEAQLSQINSTKGQETLAAETVLKQAWGAAYEQNLAAANAVVVQSFSKETQEAFQQSPLSRNPELIQLISTLGLSSQEPGTLAGFGQTGSAQTDLQTRAETLLADPAYRNAKDPKHKAVAQEVTEIYQILATQKS